MLLRMALQFWECRLNQCGSMFANFALNAFGVVGCSSDVERALASMPHVIDVPFIAMLDSFSMNSPDGSLETPASLAATASRLMHARKLSVLGVGVQATPEFIAPLVEIANVH